jgi:lipopolysaccharide/colanic/teichoic acid biosynthesis glycosyltransferase/glycosyltransferase involved in cell wall biosynthesis
MKILIVHQHYLFPGQPGGSRFNEMAKAWSEAGHQVRVIAGTLNYATGETPQRYRGRWMTRERDGAVDVWRCRVPMSYSRGYFGRMWAFLGWTLSASLAAVRVGIPDVVIATSPPLIAPIPGWILARLRGRPVPWVFEVRDLWPESAVTTGVLRRGSLLTALLYRLEAWACRRADRVNVLTPAFRDDLLRRRLAPAKKIVFVPNGADTDQFAPGPRDNDARRAFGWGDRFVLMYAGAHGRANAVGQLVEAASRLRERRDILIACVGDGPERVQWQEEARRLGLENIVFHGPQPKERMPDLVRACDAGAAVLQDNPTFRTVYPNKVFDYMACAKPTLLAIDGVARDLVCEEARAGIFARPEDAQDLAEKISWLADHPSEGEAMGLRGLDYVRSKYTRKALAKCYLGILQDLAARRPVPTSERLRPSFRGIGDLMNRGVALALLALLSPLLLILAVGVAWTMGVPVLFRQDRLGHRGRVFKLVKFRSMKSGTGSDRDRLTAFGRFLRATSLDELPELWNVVRGEMRLVGPRPLLVQYRDRYSPTQFRRHDVPPGITGWAQVNGRNALSWERRFELDVWYVDHASWALDLKILLRTVGRVLLRQGISAPGEATMPEFMGSGKGA